MPVSLSIHFSQIFSLSTSQVCFHSRRALDLLPEASPALTPPGQAGLAFRHFLGGTFSTFFAPANDLTAAPDSPL